MLVTVTDVDEDIPTFSGQVYISEYAEGTSNNKYLEIFNGTQVRLILMIMLWLMHLTVLIQEHMTIESVHSWSYIGKVKYG